MEMTRRRFAATVLGGAALGSLGGLGSRGAAAEGGGGTAATTRYVRFEANGARRWGILEETTIRAIHAAPWDGGRPTGDTMPLEKAKLLCPSEPTKILAMAGNYKSHLGDTPVPKNPEVFFKVPSCLQDPEGAIVIPPGTTDVHYEGELVVVIGKRAKDVSRAEAAASVLGFACGNDVSARDWQANDRQWWRAKSCDTFGPVGPWIAAGLDASNLRLVTRLNGQVKQETRTSELIHDVPSIVSFISRHVTLLPGDLIFTGTSGTTSAMRPGDVVEVEIEGIGVLRNRVA